MDMFRNVAASGNICLSWQKVDAKALLSGFSAKKKKKNLQQRREGKKKKKKKLLLRRKSSV